MQFNGKSKIIAVQMDSLNSINYATDSTFLISLALQHKGYDLFFYEVHNLLVCDGEVKALGVFATLNLSEPYYQLKSEAMIDLSAVLLVMVRQDPPFNMNYITATYILDLVKDITLVLNDSSQIRNFPEKFSPLLFQDCLPSYIITANIDQIGQFAARYEFVVVKPIYQHGGRDVIKASVRDPNFRGKIRSHLKKFHHVIVQEFMHNVLVNGEKRILLLNGEILGHFIKKPTNGDFRSNVVLGAETEKCELSLRELEICSKIGEFLASHDLIFAGIDLLDEKLIEINVTSPTGLAVLNSIYGGAYEKKVADIIEEKVHSYYKERVSI